jgi:cysteine-rich repeat protein
VNAKAWLWALSLLALSNATQAAAQTIPTTTRTITFEADCDGGDLTGGFDITGYKTVLRDLFKKCGVASIVSGGSGTVGAQQLHSPLDPPFGPGTIPGEGPGKVVLSGALSLNGSISLDPLEITFNPPVNEVSFDVLDLDNPSGLAISAQGVGGVAITVLQPSVKSDKSAHFSTTSTTPIEQVTIAYSPSTIIDGWFVDTLTYNAWKCGDGETEAGGNEQCDDKNSVQCDGCRTDCQQDNVGCLDGTTCILDKAIAAGSFGCARCDVKAAPVAGKSCRLRPPRAKAVTTVSSARTMKPATDLERAQARPTTATTPSSAPRTCATKQKMPASIPSWSARV